MLFAAVLLIATLAAWLIGLVGRRPASWRDHARRGMAIAMVVAGLAHLVGPEPFVDHLPDWVPGREPLVLVSGLVEIALGLALVGRRAWRSLSGRLLALYLLAVWPANIYVAAAGVDVEGQPGGAYPWIRLPFQILFVAWALWSTRDDVPATSPDGAATAHAAHAADAVGVRAS